jgi:hypothetical protein
MSMGCGCASLFRLDGNAAQQYASEHLEELSVDPVNWLVHYRCPATGRLWLRDAPQGHLHGGGPPRLRQLDPAGTPIDEPGHDPFR